MKFSSNRRVIRSRRMRSGYRGVNQKNIRQGRKDGVKW